VGYTHPEAPLLPKPSTEFFERGIGQLPQCLAHHLLRHRITARLPAPCMRPRCHRARGPTPLPQVLDTRAADAKYLREGTLGTALFVISPEDFLTKLEGVGFHGGHVMPYLPFIQLRTALGDRTGRDAHD
jgi:hypothetical protein